MFLSFALYRFLRTTTELHITLTRILQITTISLLAVMSGFNTLSAPSLFARASNDRVQEIAVEKPKPVSTKEAVTTYFSDIPIMVDIARCESRFRHTDTDGTVLRGLVNSADVGVMQINEYYHLVESKKLGYNIHSIDGNMAYARYLYEKQGARPWLSSSPCWSKTQPIVAKN